MGRSYSLDLRVRVAAFVEAGQSRRAAARHFGVSDSFAIKLLRRQAQFTRAQELLADTQLDINQIAATESKGRVYIRQYS
jgi:transposase